MVELKWTSKVFSDLARPHEFLILVSAPAADHAVQRLVAAPATLLANPRIGERLDEFDPPEVWRILVAIMKCAANFKAPLSTCCDCGTREKSASWPVLREGKELDQRDWIELPRLVC